MRDYVAEAGFNDDDILAILKKARNVETIEERENKKAQRRRRAKADFCNLNEKTIKEAVFF